MFSYDNNGRCYCRKCIEFKGEIANIDKYITPPNFKFKLNYKLSNEQKIISDNLLGCEGDIYVDAVCGAGKTEIVFESINRSLRIGQRVGFIIPRREVVKEIFVRLKNIYQNTEITCVYGGHSQKTDGDIIVLTAHQSYKYNNKFGLIIVDEYDAFPFKNNEVLHKFVQDSCYGKRIFLSATFSKQELLNKNHFSLNKRYHNQEIPIPIFRKVPNAFQIVFSFFLIKKLLKDDSKVVLVFFPTIALSRLYFSIYKPFFKNKIIIFNSKVFNKEKEFIKIKNKEYKIIITTTILERGITIENVDLVVIHANDSLFDKSTLIQIAGRVGRVYPYTKGNIFFVANCNSLAIKESILEIKSKNE